jgi:hypothetical protein
MRIEARLSGPRPIFCLLMSWFWLQIISSGELCYEFMFHKRRRISSQMSYYQLLNCMELLEVSVCVVWQAICPGHGM